MKFAVADREQRVALAALGIERWRAEVRQVYYVDTPDLDLLAQGVVLRARRGQRGDHDTAVKLRPVAAAEFSKKWRSSAGFSVEVDVAPGMNVCTATLKSARGRARLDAALTGERPLHDLFSKRQRALLADCGPGEIDWEALRALGPVDVSKVTTRVPQLGRRLVAQRWRYPDDSSLLELSTRVRPRDLEKRRAFLWTFVSELGLDLATRQETKAERTLAFFAGRSCRNLYAAAPNMNGSLA